MCILKLNFTNTSFEAVSDMHDLTLKCEMENLTPEVF